ncbi:MAG: ATP-binding cassette, subfamily multidrug efflux pump [Gaiellales bacterium]|nr:ATP-binding cassette, subfamily multidrug efflux pump [Gaiellales bacterium]
MSRSASSWSRNRRLLRLVRPYRLGAAASLVSLLVGVGANLAGPALAQRAIDRGIYTHGHLVHDRTTLALWVGAFVAAILIGWAAMTVQTYATSWVGRRVLSDLRIDLFAHIQRLELGYFERERAGRIISRLTNDVDALEELVTDGVTSTLRNSLILVGTAVALVLLDWRLALATLVVFPPMAAATIVFRVRSSRANRVMRERLADVTATLAEDLAGVRVIEEFDRDAHNSVAFDGTSRVYREANGRTVWLNAWYFPFVELLSVVGVAIVLVYGGYLTIQGAIGVGTLFAFVLYLQNFFDPVQQLSLVYNTYLAATAALNRIFDVMDTEPELVDEPGALALDRIEGLVELDDVRFGYGDGPDVLHGLHLRAEPGTTVALVGHTGAGKSTIVKLLARFYDPRSGSVRIDGHDVKTVQAATLRRQLGIVPQESFLFAGTIAENIAYARPDATRGDVEDAARAVGADGFIDELPETYDTQVAERGHALSAGERQLVALARAFLADPRILVLDEATSSVDIATERKIGVAISTLLEGRTSFVVAHRLSTIQNADMIVVLEDGRVVEQGAHDELLALRGRYSALYEDWAREPAA